MNRRERAAAVAGGLGVILLAAGLSLCLLAIIGVLTGQL